MSMKKKQKVEKAPRTSTKKRPTKIGNYLRVSRQSAGPRDRPMSLMKAAELLGYDKNSVQGYEVGVRLPDVQYLVHAARIYKKDFRYLLSLLLRDQTVRGSDPPEPDMECDKAADQIKVLHHQQVLDPKSALAGSLDHELLAKILAAMGRVEKRWRMRLMPTHKARVVSALYGVAKLEGQDHDLGIEFLLKAIRDDHPDYLE